MALLTGRLLIIKGTMCSDSLQSVSRNILILSARTDISQLLFYRGRETHTQGGGREKGERGREIRGGREGMERRESKRSLIMPTIQNRVTVSM